MNDRLEVLKQRVKRQYPGAVAAARNLACGCTVGGARFGKRFEPMLSLVWCEAHMLKAVGIRFLHEGEKEA